MMSGDLRRLPVCAVDDGEDDEYAVLGQRLAVADDDVLDVADGEAVNHDDVRRRLFLEPDYLLALVLDLEDGTVVGNDDRFFGQIVRLAGDVAVGAEHVMVAVERHEELRMDLLVDPCRLIAVGVAG